jgi:large subunit ribosomal protein L7/L12
MANKVEQLLNDISALTVVELAELTKLIEDKFGVTAAAPAAAVAAPVAAEAAPKAEEKTEFKVELVEIPAEKTPAIKALRQIKKDLGLLEAKKVVESAPCVLIERANKEEAEAAKKIMEEAGAKIKLS